jgi:hypothetical protein
MSNVCRSAGRRSRLRVTREGQRRECIRIVGEATSAPKTACLDARGYSVKWPTSVPVSIISTVASDGVASTPLRPSGAMNAATTDPPAKAQRPSNRESPRWL